jgi:hypothetical protein
MRCLFVFISPRHSQFYDIASSRTDAPAHHDLVYEAEVRYLEVNFLVLLAGIPVVVVCLLL